MKDNNTHQIYKGVGAFTIVDDAIVQPFDLGNNFFLESKSLGQSKAESMVELLTELNDSVKGHAIMKVICIMHVHSVMCARHDDDDYTIIIIIR